MKKVLAVLAVLALLLTAAFAAAEEAGGPVFQWGDQGRVQLTSVGDYSEDMKLQVSEKPKGKWIVVVLTILDGAEMQPATAFDLAKDNITLDGVSPTQLAGRGAKINIELNQATLVGDIDAFFDVPVDYDLSKAVLKINGEEVAIPAPAEAAAE